MAKKDGSGQILNGVIGGTSVKNGWKKKNENPNNISFKDDRRVAGSRDGFFFQKKSEN